MHTTSLISKAAVRPAALTFHCTVIPGSTNSGVEHSHKMQHHSPVRSPAETAEYRLMCSTEPICMGSGESADVRRGDAEEGERKEDEPVFLLRSWRKQAGLVCIVWVTFVKWALLFQLLHYSNTCYWDHWRAHWHQCGVRLSHRVDLGGGAMCICFGSQSNWYICHQMRVEKAVAPSPNPHNAQWRTSSAGHEECENLPKQRHVSVRLCVFGYEPLWATGPKLCNMCWCRGSHSSRDKGAPAWPSPFVSVIWRGA